MAELKKRPVNGSHNLSRFMGKPVFGISDQVLHKHSYKATEDGKGFELSFGFKYCNWFNIAFYDSKT